MYVIYMCMTTKHALDMYRAMFTADSCLCAAVYRAQLVAVLPVELLQPLEVATHF